MSTSEKIAFAAVVLTGIGIVVGVVAPRYRSRRQREADETEKVRVAAAERREEELAALARETNARQAEAARAKLSAEYLDGPTAVPPDGTWCEFRFRITNVGREYARNPFAQLVDAETEEAVEPNGASAMDSDGLLAPDKSSEVVLGAPSLGRPLRLKLRWFAYEGPDWEEHLSRVLVPLSKEDAARKWAPDPP